MTYCQYWVFLPQPILFVLTVSALTPDTEESNTREHFLKRVSIIYGLMAAFLGSQLLSGDDPHPSLVAPRLVATGLLVVVAVTRRLEIISLLVAVWLVALSRRL